MAKTEEPKKEIKLEVYVTSNVQGECYVITVTVKGITEGKYSYDYQDKYTFYTNKHLSKLECTKCEDSLFLNIATEHAIEHMKELRKIKKVRFPLFNIFKEEE